MYKKISNILKPINILQQRLSQFRILMPPVQYNFKIGFDKHIKSTACAQQQWE